MKMRESGMPDEQTWRTFFDPEQILQALHLTSTCKDIVDLGCGYGTFTIPAAHIVSGITHAFDVEPDMISSIQIKLNEEKLLNVKVYLRDFFEEGTGLPGGSVDYVMLFNILHAEQPERLIQEAHRILSTNGRLGIVHWNYDPKTPRGPSMEIRPKPEDCIKLATQGGFRLLPPGIIQLPPYHYGIAVERE